MKALIAVLIVILSGIVFATDNIPVSVMANGFQVVDWKWTATDAGAASGVTVSPVYGQLYRAFWQPDPATANLVAHSSTITVKEFQSNPTWSGVGSDVAGGAVTHNTGTLKTIAFWPTTHAPVASKLQLDLTGAQTLTHTGAHGRLVLVVAPSEGE